MSKQVKFLVAVLGVIIIVIGGGYLYQKTQNESQNKAITYDCEQGKTAFAILQKNRKLETKDTNFGKQVMAIDGVKPNDKQYWAFYVDGKLAPVGAEAYNCNGKEKVEWKLEGF